jgi:CheY-like chemotaxis protein
VTAVGSLPANDDQSELAEYEAVVLGLGGSSKENVKAFKHAASSVGNLSKLIVWSPNSDALRSVVSARPELASVPVVENPAQIPALITPRANGEPLGDPRQSDAGELAGAKVLIVDDDIRNIYTLTSVLESWDVEVLHAEQGAEGIAILEQVPDVDVALIDIMMPEMDGYQTMQEIKRRPRIARIPLISVTAKAMKGDRQKCIEAGASDYISKPVDLDLLLALLRVWVGRSRSQRQAAEASASGKAAN